MQVYGRGVPGTLENGEEDAVIGVKNEVSIVKPWGSNAPPSGVQGVVGSGVYASNTLSCELLKSGS